MLKHTFIKYLQMTSRMILVVSYFFLISMAASPIYAQTVPLTAEDMIRESKQIVVATVTEKNVHWNEQHTFIVTDYVLTIEDRLKGSSPAMARISVLGGTIDGETHQTCVSTHFEVRQRYLLFLEDLDRQTLTPITGGPQGMIREVKKQDGKSYVGSGFNGALLHTQQKANVTFQEFVEKLRQLIMTVEAKPTPSMFSQPEETSSSVKLYSKRYDPTDMATNIRTVMTPMAPLSPSIPESPASPLVENVTTGTEIIARELWTDDRDQPTYAWERRPPAPIVFNQLPASITPWAPHDQYMMAYWNRYADLFRVMQTPSNTWAWGNGRFDIAGWVSDLVMRQQFGSGWGATTLAVTFYRWYDNGSIVEADIAFNPAFSWTLNNEYATRNDNNTYGFEQTVLHELGHSFGLQHPWERQDVWWDSVMNYAPKSCRLPRLMADDTAAIRSAYPGVSIHDGLLSSYITRDDSGDNSPSYVESYPPSSVQQDTSFSMSEAIKIENTGTDDLVDPSIEIYLTPSRLSWSGARYLKTASFSLRLGSFRIAHLSLSPILVSTSIPPGNYYVGFYLRDSSDGYTGNNSAWSLSPLLVVNSTAQANSFTGSPHHQALFYAQLPTGVNRQCIHFDMSAWRRTLNSGISLNDSQNILLRHAWTEPELSSPIANSISFNVGNQPEEVSKHIGGLDDQR